MVSTGSLNSPSTFNLTALAATGDCHLELLRGQDFHTGEFPILSFLLHYQLCFLHKELPYSKYFGCCEIQTMRLEDDYLIPFLSPSVFRMMTRCSGNFQSNSRRFPYCGSGVCMCVCVQGVWSLCRGYGVYIGGMKYHYEHRDFYILMYFNPFQWVFFFPWISNRFIFFKWGAPSG